MTVDRAEIIKIISDYVDNYMKQTLKMAKNHFTNHTRFVEDMVNQQGGKMADLIREQGDSIIAIFVKSNQTISKHMADLEDRIYQLEHK